MTDSFARGTVALSLGIFAVLRAAPARAQLTVPPGYVVDRVAAAPLVQRPTSASFDERGRLYVVDSDANHVAVLEDVNADGRFDKSSVFADNLPSARGLLWHDGFVYVASGATLWRLRDADGDGVCDERKQLLTGFAADAVHGACVGPDGLLYISARRGAHDVKDAGGKVLHKSDSALLVRCRADGSGAEVLAAPQGNPVEVAWTPAGDVIASGDAVAHTLESGDQDTGGPLPPLAGTEPSAGLARYRGMTMGRAYTGGLLSAHPNAHGVRRHTLTAIGATFAASTEALVWSDDAEFRPTDVLEDADGTVLVIDAGGGIYRVSKDNGVRIADPRGLKLNWQNLPLTELIRRLHDLRPCVIDRATRELARAAKEAAPVLTDALTRTPNPDARLHVAWALARGGAPESRDALRLALLDPSPPVRQVAAYAFGLRRDPESIPQLIGALLDESPPVRREAANALGRIGNPAAAVATTAVSPAPPPGAVPGGPPPGVMMAPQGEVRVAAAPAGEATPTAQAAPAPASKPSTAPATAPASQPGAPGAPTAPAPSPAPVPAPPPAPSPAVAPLLNVLRGGTDRFLEHAVVYALIRINDRASTSKGLEDADPAVARGAKLALDGMGTPAPVAKG